MRSPYLLASLSAACLLSLGGLACTSSTSSGPEPAPAPAPTSSSPGPAPTTPGPGPGDGTLRFSEITGYCAREALSGNVYCWGPQGMIAYQSGLASQELEDAFPTPTRLPPRSLTEIVGGAGWVCGRDVTDVWCIGDDSVTAASGVASPNARRAWAKIKLPTGVLLTKLVGGGRFVCGIGAPNSPERAAVGKVYCWGENNRSELGRGTDTTPGSVVAPIAGDGVYVALAGGGQHACATRENGDVDCWGSNIDGTVAAGELGGGNVSPAPRPRGLTVDPRQGAILPVCGIKVGGQAFCWGDNYYGQMGDGTNTTGVAGQNYRTPSEVPTLRFKAISTGPTMCGIAIDDKVFCWGLGQNGSLGNGSTLANPGAANGDDARQKTPAAVSVPAGVTFAQITNLANGKCARSTDNRVYCWGSSTRYETGAGVRTAMTVPTELPQPAASRAMP
ncbi:MAG: hypothetical protein JNL38_08680 [Myxococcales bacterium]|nr:hypothetical protein [Myxococcales bacterium]